MQALRLGKVQVPSLQMSRVLCVSTLCASEGHWSSKRQLCTQQFGKDLGAHAALKAWNSYRCKALHAVASWMTPTRAGSVG